MSLPSLFHGGNVADANLEALPVSHSMIRSVKGIGRPMLTRVETHYIHHCTEA